MAERTLYLPSTSFNLLACLLDMCQCQPVQAQLIMIDQHCAPPYLSLLKEEGDFPFQRVDWLPAAQGWNKPFQRRRDFQRLWQWTASFAPTEIVVGSDRRIEFQYLMHRFRRQGRTVKGVYLDDGLYSYMSWPRNRLSSWLDTMVKKLAYGFWWRTPPSVGDSEWIEEARLFAPAMARAALKQRSIVSLEGERLMNPPISRLVRRVVEQAGVEAERLMEAEKVILMPHPHDLRHLNGFECSVRREVETAAGPVCVKYHPRAAGKDMLGLRRMGVSILPGHLPFEFFLPLLSEAVEVVGDLTTALLSTRWMRPALRVRALGHLDGRVDEALLRLYARFGVEMSGERQ